MRSNAKKVIGNIEKKLKAAINDAPMVLGNTGTRLFMKNFERQGYGDDDTRKPWKPRKKETRKTKGKKILVGTGQLRRAVANSLRQANSKRIVWNVRIAYGLYHNDGTEHLPRRRFMASDYFLKKSLRKKYEQIFKSALR